MTTLQTFCPLPPIISYPFRHSLVPVSSPKKMMCEKTSFTYSRVFISCWLGWGRLAWGKTQRSGFITMVSNKPSHMAEVAWTRKTLLLPGPLVHSLDGGASTGTHLAFFPQRTHVAVINYTTKKLCKSISYLHKKEGAPSNAGFMLPLF